MATHSSPLGWQIPWREEPGRLESMGSLGATSLSHIGEGNGNPLQCSCLENARDGGAWWAAIYGVAQSQTRLKRLSCSSSSSQQAPLPYFLGVFQLFSVLCPFLLLLLFFFFLIAFRIRLTGTTKTLLGFDPD